MVQISHNFGNSNVNGLGNLGKVQQNNGDSPKPETVINELKIHKGEDVIYDDGKGGLEIWLDKHNNVIRMIDNTSKS